MSDSVEPQPPIDLSLYNSYVGKLAMELGRGLYRYTKNPDEPYSDIEPANFWGALDTYLVVEKGIHLADGEMTVRALSKLVARKK